jgi:hypothetical protein
LRGQRNQINFGKKSKAMRRAYHLIPILVIGLATGCTHLQQARDSHFGTEPAAFVKKVGDDVCGVGAYNPD